MKKILQLNLKVLFILGLLSFSMNMSAQENRSFDGKGNNLQHPQWGAVGTNQLQVLPNGFADGISEPGGINRPSPRVISNSVFNQEGLLPDELTLSDYAWVWAQFIDHDITLVGDNHNERLEIPIPKGDPFFDPSSTGTAKINILRSSSDPNSGTSTSNPRAFPNIISSYIDASAIYGSTEERANWLRSFEGGKIRMSAGNLLPYNTTTGEKNGPVDVDAPEMAMANPFFTKWFVSGDIRANENPLLTSLHTIFTREHNRQCEQLAAKNPDWNDEQLYQHARKIVGGLMQAIVYEEWLPVLGVHLGEYGAYDPLVEVGVMNIFSAAAYRYGHSVINSKIFRMDNNKNTIPEGDILLRDAFFNPNVISELGGIDPLLIGMSWQVEQDFDCKMVHDLRNFLFGAPGSGGLDLAAINIQRGRERGLPDYNTARVGFGLPRVESFNKLTNNPWLNQTLEQVYGDINNVDAWVGFLAEDHMSDALFGRSVMRIMEKQFSILRDGDRYYYEIDPGLSDEEKEEIKNTRLKEVIMRNSGVISDAMPASVFVVKLSTPVTNVIKDFESIKVEVYPNPTTKNLFINVAAFNNGQASLEITDLLGQVIQQKTLEVLEGMNTFEFNLDESLASGIYIVTLRMNNRVGRQKIYKN